MNHKHDISSTSEAMSKLGIECKPSNHQAGNMYWDACEQLAQIKAEHAALKREKHQYFLALRDIADASPNWMQSDAVADSERRMRNIAQVALLAQEGKDGE